MENNILKLKVDNKYKNLENYLKPQWSWKTLSLIVLFSLTLAFYCSRFRNKFSQIND